MIDDCNVRALYLYIFFYIYTKYLIYKYVIITNENSFVINKYLKGIWLNLNMISLPKWSEARQYIHNNIKITKSIKLYRHKRY